VAANPYRSESVLPKVCFRSVGSIIIFSQKQNKRGAASENEATGGYDGCAGLKRQPNRPSIVGARHAAQVLKGGAAE
jgi:hypothetical protein